MVLDVTEDDTQSYIEDCEVCCRPIQITYTSENEELVFFDKSTS